MAVEYTPPPEPTAARTAMPAGLKVALGIGAGCLVLGMIVAGACGLGVWWFVSPGRQIEPTVLIGDDTVGLIGSTDPGGDEGVMALATRLFATVQELSREQQSTRDGREDGWGKRLRQYQNPDPSGAAIGVKMLIPRNAHLVLERVTTPDSEPYVAVVNFAAMVRFYRMMLESAAQTAGGGSDLSSYRDRTLLVSPDGAVMCFMDGTLLVSGDHGTMRTALDRVIDGSAGGESRRSLAERYRELSRRWNLYGVIDNGSGDAAGWIAVASAWIDHWAAQPVPAGGDTAGPGSDWLPADDVAWLEFGVDVVSIDRVAAEAEVRLRTTEAAGRVADDLERRLESWSVRVSDLGVAVDADIVANGYTVVMTLDLDGVEIALDRTLARLLSVEGPDGS